MSKMEDHAKLLDQLQTEVNRVLEQTGRLFAAVNSDNKKAAAAQATRLKQVAPASAKRFNHALDELETELQLARNVMRRDLAVQREKSDPNAKPITKVESEVKNGAPAASTSTQEGVKSPEVIMSDDPPEQSKESNATAPSAENDTVMTLDDENTIKPEEGSKPETKLNTDISKDTSAPQSEKAPDTGPNSAAADLDSLFNDTGSAAADEGNASTNNDGTDNAFSNNDNNDNDFDFGAFSASFENNNNSNNNDDSGAGDSSGAGGDNENLSSLLPGLQDYANTQSNGDSNMASGDVDFDALFATEGTAGGDENGGEMRDTTFDDLMNFGDFGSTDFANNGGNTDDNFDFDFN